MSYFKEKELLEKRGDCLDKQEALLKSAEGRDLTTEENRENDRLESEYNKLTREIATHRAELMQQPLGLTTEKILMNETTTQNPSTWTDSEGRSVNVYAPGQRISQIAPEMTIGRLARAMVSGARNEEESRALAAGTDSAGGFTVPSVTVSDFFDRLRAKSRVVSAGAQTVTLTSDETTFARVSGDPSVVWHQENAAETSSDLVFEGATFRPRTMYVMVRASRELIADSVNAEAVLESVFAGTIASALDQGILFGTGASGQIKGLATYPLAEVDMGTNGAPLLNYTPLVAAYRKLLDNNASAPTGFLMSPREWEVLANLADTTNQPMLPPRVLENIPMYETTHFSTDESHGNATNASRILCGNFADLVIGMRQNMRIELLKERFADNFQYGFLVSMRVDALPARLGSFSQITGIVPE